MHPEKPKSHRDVLHPVDWPVSIRDKQSIHTMRAPQSFHIMVTDINHHVRQLIMRELEKDGYTVFCVKTGVMLYEFLCRQTAFDLLILDPELFEACDRDLFGKVLEHKPSRTIILHTYRDIFDGQKTGDNVQLVEKGAESINVLKERVHACYLQTSGSKVSEIFTGCKGG